MFNAMVMEDSDGCFPNPVGIGEGDGCQVLGQTNDFLDQLVTSEAHPRCREKRFTKCTRCKCEIFNVLVVEDADLV